MYSFDGLGNAMKMCTSFASSKYFITAIFPTGVIWRLVHCAILFSKSTSFFSILRSVMFVMLFFLKYGPKTLISFTHPYCRNLYCRFRVTEKGAICIMFAEWLIYPVRKFTRLLQAVMISKKSGNHQIRTGCKTGNIVLTEMIFYRFQLPLAASERYNVFVKQHNAHIFFIFSMGTSPKRMCHFLH